LNTYRTPFFYFALFDILKFFNKLFILLLFYIFNKMKDTKHRIPDTLNLCMYVLRISRQGLFIWKVQRCNILFLSVAARFTCETSNLVVRFRVALCAKLNFEFCGAFHKDICGRENITCSHLKSRSSPYDSMPCCIALSNALPREFQ